MYYEKPGFLWEHSYVLNTYYYRLKVVTDPRLAGYFDYVAEAYDGPTWQRQRARLEALAALVRQRGGRLVVVTFPFFELMEDERYRAIHARLAAFWDELGVPHVDLLDDYRSRPMAEWIVNRYDTHPNERAHALAAERIGELLERAMAQEPASSG